MSTRNKGIPAKKAASKKPAKRKAAPKAKKVLVSKKKPVARKKAKPRAYQDARIDACAKEFDKVIHDHLAQPPKSWWRRALSRVLGRFHLMAFF